MEDYDYSPMGVCSRKIHFSLDEEKKLHDVSFEGGCKGNLKAIGLLVEGKDAAEVAEILKGNQCGLKGTSCADQLSKALKKALAEA